MNKKKWLNAGMWTLHLLLASGFVTLFCFAKIEYKKEVCKRVIADIHRENDNMFLDENDLMNVLYEIEPTGFIGVKRGDINLLKIEKDLVKYKYVANADVFINNQSELIVSLKERYPLLRIINKKGVSYYVDHHGKKMPFSAKFTSRVIVANGYITGDYPNNDTLKSTVLQDLYKLTKQIHALPELKTAVQQIYVNKAKEYELVTLFGSHTVLLGDLSNLDDKLNGLIAFYKASKDKVDLSKYKAINLKYKHQIVCKKF
jgi:cell division protein FtsQ